MLAMFLRVFVTLSLYQIAKTNHVPPKEELGSLLASLKAVENAAGAAASEFQLSRTVKKSVPLQSDLKVNLVDVIKEKKLRKILELIKENNKATLQDVNDKSKGPRIFIIKENVSGDYERSSEEEEAAFSVHPSRRYPGDISSDSFEERRNEDAVKPRYIIFDESREPTRTRSKGRAYVSDDDDIEYTTKRKVYRNKIDISTGNDWDQPSPLRQVFPKYTDGPFNEENNGKRIRQRPSGHKKPRGIPYNYSKEEKWDSKTKDNNVRSPNKPYRSYGIRNRDEQRLMGRTVIPYRSRNVYEK